LITFLFFSCVLSLRQHEDAFQQFVKDHRRTYTNIEYEKKFEVFKGSLNWINKLNANSKHAQFKINKFADMTQEEFRATHHGPKFHPQVFAEACLANGVTKELDYDKSILQDVPTAWDWRTTGGKDGKGIVTPVKDQGQCGSCWAFSTTGAIESLWAKLGNTMAELSEQQIVDCSHGCSNITGYGPVCNQGCNGGFQWSAYEDIMAWGGLETETEYPYTAYDGTCHMQKSLFIAPIKNYTCLSGGPRGLPADEVKLQAYIYQNGPVSIALDAGLLQFYWGGIVDPFFPNLECDPNSLDHALLIVGWGQERNWIGEMTPYWIVKNSWSDSWGEAGYFLIARNYNICGIANAISAPLM